MILFGDRYNFAASAAPYVFIYAKTINSRYFITGIYGQ